jgi:filamentous hemagglutinin family protein
MKTSQQLLCLIINMLLLNTPLQADIITDGTLGQTSALVGPNYLINDKLGQQVGGNLFHSFQTFNLNTGESATFTGPNSVNNIISRITGGNPSKIDGLLRSTIPNADVYFINPYGIMFGENARLDVQGSFHASTADYLRLGKDGRFDVRQPSNSLLTVAPVEAFGFLTNTPAPITIQDSTLSVSKGKTLSVLGGDLQIEDGTLYAPRGRINLVAVNSTGEVVPTLSDLAAESFEKLGNITLSSSLETNKPLNINDISPETLAGNKPQANIDVSGVKGGQVFIRAGQFFLDKGLVFADTYGDKQGLGIDIFIDGNMHLMNGAKISADNYGNGQSGHINVTTTNALLLSGQDAKISYHYDEIFEERQNFFNSSSAISATSWTYGRFGKGGNIQITTPVLEVRHGTIQTSTMSTLNSGDIRVDAQQITLQDNGFIHAVTTGDGQAGNINVTVTDKISLLNGSGIVAATNRNSSAKAGNIQLTTQELKLENVGFIISANEGAGNAGSITLETETASLTHESRINTRAVQGGGGNINLSVRDHLYLADNSRITAEAQGTELEHSGGNLTIKSPRLFTLNNSLLLANAKRGRGGNIDVRATQLRPLGDSVIDASSELGLNGRLFINDIDISNNIIPLSINYLAAETLLPTRCAARSGTNLSRFIVTGPEILPESPSALSVHIPAQLLNPLADKPSDDSNTSALNSQTSRLFMGCRRH